MGIKYQSSDGRTERDMPAIGNIPPIHGLYMFNPNACISSADVKGGGYDANGNFIGPDKCILCGPIVPPPPPPVIPPAEIYSIAICFWITGPRDYYSPEGCWRWNRYVNYDGPPPLNFIDEPYPLVIPTIYEGYMLNIDTIYGYTLNDVAHSVGDNTVASASVYTIDPSNPSAPPSFNYTVTQAVATDVVNKQLAAAHAALGI